MLQALSLLIPALLLAPTLAKTPEEWSSRSIYQLITDRFATTNGTATPCDSSKREYCGGTWKGIEDHLDYIQYMGFDAIWISPITANIEGNFSAGEAYHGYWSQNLDEINHHFGTEQDLKDLGAAVHKRDMYLMVDVVVNHMAATALPPKFNFDGFFHPFTDQSYFHPQCFINSTETDQHLIEQCWFGNPEMPLPDLNTENSTVVDLLNSWIHNLVQEFDVDGLRIDTVKHIRKDFWPEWVQSAGVYTLGEVVYNDSETAAPWTEVVDAILDYPTYFKLSETFSGPVPGKFPDLVTMMERSQANYKHGLFQTGSFIENHDQPRVAGLTQDAALIRNAMTFSFIHDGIPIALWFSAYEQEKPIVQHFRTLNAARKAAIASTSSFLTTPFMSVHDESVAILKPPMLALLTNIGSQEGKSATWEVPGAYAPNEMLVDVLTCSHMMANAQGDVVVPSDYGMPQVLMPASKLPRGGSLCPDMATGERAVSGASKMGIKPAYMVAGVVASLMWRTVL
ncbi:glycoside hydrolase family 13 protein [Amylostereum chailletii]|nr:glycoside hydrolase family 13 protein [Amylostereum chailletii]